MTRMKRGEEGHAEAVAKWRKTMYEKYGGPEGVHAKMQAIGHKGGSQVPKTPRGFASNVVGKDGMTGLERAKAAGRKGGQISRRGTGGKTRKDKGVTRGPRTKVGEKPVRKFNLWPFGRNTK